MSYLKTVRRRWSEAAVQQSVRRIMHENVLCSMSTIGARNRPHINTAYFCYSPSMEIFFISDVGSAHCRNLNTNPSMAMAVFRSTQTWGGSDRGLQLFGTCRPVAGRLADRAKRLYGTRFPRYARLLAARSGAANRAAEQLRSYAFYRFVPQTVKILDERVFGGAVFVVVSIPKP
ncbi:MAG TPA: pyridoxamine 5'-phosphate oxidase family protein [Thermoplasmata archaeon]|nr:pyridoxamine 5'-phosphate oxidase family protein [Thermoplasmata archaeon]